MSSVERFHPVPIRRTRVVPLLPIPATFLQVDPVLCVDLSEEWLIGRGYRCVRSSFVAGADDPEEPDQSEEVASVASWHLWTA